MVSFLFYVYYLPLFSSKKTVIYSKGCIMKLKRRKGIFMTRVDINVNDCDGSEYVFFPACVYAGNGFDVLKRGYPPMFQPCEARVDMPVTITDVPRLEKDGSGRIEVTTGDVSIPCVGVFNMRKGKAVLVFTIQQIDGENLGLAYEMGLITISYPALRKEIYRANRMEVNQDTYQGNNREIPYRIIEFNCKSMEEFFSVYFTERKCMGLDDSRAEVLPYEIQFEILRKKFNEMNWYKEGQYYDIDTKGMWQPGWCGGAMAGYPLMKMGGELEKHRAVMTLRHLFENQAPCGMFYGFNIDRNDGFKVKGAEKWLLIRKSADCLYFMFKYFELMEKVPANFIEGTKRVADCFLNIWNKYGQFGQFIDCDSGDIVVGGSTSGAIIPAGLAEAYKYFKEERYLKVALESADMMYERDAIKGYTTGGPGEILQCPDSESAFALLESMVVLYEITGDPKWLEYSRFMAYQCSSWVVGYNYLFPGESEFKRLGMKTTGSVFANVQNKHSAPGICTLSAGSLLKLYKWTNDELYMELYKDISLTLGQYISTNERPIYSWDRLEESCGGKGTGDRSERFRLPQGFINERVNMSDWEGYKRIGEVFHGSCWSEVSNLLTLVELMETNDDIIKRT